MIGINKQGELNMDKWLTLEQIAEYLQMSTSSIYKMAQAGKIPAYKVGRQWRFRIEEIDKWVTQKKTMNKLTDLQKKIVTLAIKHWKKNFTGISALDISENLDKTHEEILIEAGKLEQLGFFHIRENVDLYPIKFGIDEDGKFIHERMGKVTTSMLFPTKIILKEIFEKERKDYGYYTNQLHLGDSQISLRFFKQEVLKKYFDQPEKYYINDDIVNGRIGTRDQYYFSLPEAIREQNQEIISQIRYGKRKLSNGSLAIAVILIDLSRLPLREQLYWAGFEIDNPTFAEKDEEYENFLRQNFLAEWIDYKDPLKQIIKIINDINEICITKYNLNFFRETENPRLKYPLINNKGNYIEAHKELWKVIGSFNKSLVKKLVEDLSIQKPSYYDKLKEYGLFKLLFSNLENNKRQGILKPFEICNQARNKDAHEIDEARIEDINFVSKFRNDCERLVESLEEIKNFFQIKINLRN